MDQLKLIKSADQVVAEVQAQIASYRAMHVLYSHLTRYLTLHNEKPKRLTAKCGVHLEEYLQSVFQSPVLVRSHNQGDCPGTDFYSVKLRILRAPGCGDEESVQLYVYKDTNVVDIERSLMGWHRLSEFADQLTKKLPTIKGCVVEYNEALSKLQSISDRAASFHNGRFREALGPLSSHFGWYELRGI